jgi:hypothetical protein
MNFDSEKYNGPDAPDQFMRDFSDSVSQLNRKVANVNWRSSHPAYALEMDEDESDDGVRASFARAVKAGEYDEVDLFGIRILVPKDNAYDVAALLNIGAVAIISPPDQEPAVVSTCDICDCERTCDAESGHH